MPSDALWSSTVSLRGIRAARVQTREDEWNNKRKRGVSLRISVATCFVSSVAAASHRPMPWIPIRKSSQGMNLQVMNPGHAFRLWVQIEGASLRGSVVTCLVSSVVAAGHGSISWIHIRKPRQVMNPQLMNPGHALRLWLQVEGSRSCSKSMDPGRISVVHKNDAQIFCTQHRNVDKHAAVVLRFVCVQIAGPGPRVEVMHQNYCSRSCLQVLGAGRGLGLPMQIMDPDQKNSRKKVSSLQQKKSRLRDRNPKVPRRQKKIPGVTS